MKLAREIVKEARMPWHRKWVRNRIPTSLIIIPEDMLEDIIAAKLEPVRDVLESLVEYAKLEGKSCSATSILALLSEE